MKTNAYLILILLSLWSFKGYSQKIEGVSPTLHLSFKQNQPTNQENPATEIPGPGKYYALLMAVEDYYMDPGIGSLSESVKDAEDFKNVLISKYGFDENNIIFLKNPTYDSIEIALENLWTIVGKNDNLLIFFGGHGYWDEHTQIGYWLPSDATQQNRAKWFKNSSIRDDINAIHSKHTLLISDACFSGSILKVRAINNASISIYDQMRLPCRRAMTSGNLSTVPAHSVFMEYLLKYLNENTQLYYPSQKLFTDIYTPILNNAENTTPQQGVIPDVGDEGGDFVFIHNQQ